MKEVFDDEEEEDEDAEEGANDDLVVVVVVVAVVSVVRWRLGTESIITSDSVSKNSMAVVRLELPWLR